MKFVFNPFTSNFDITASAPSDITGGTANTVAGFDSTGTLESIPGFGLSTLTGGLDVNLSQADLDVNQTRVIQNFVNTITPADNHTQLNYQGIQNYTYLVGPNDSNGLINLNNGVNLGTGNHNNVAVLNQSIDANSGSSTDMYLINQYMNLNAGHTNNNSTALINMGYTLDAAATGNGIVFGYNQNLQIHGDLNAQINAISSNVNVTSDMTPFGINSLIVNDAVSAPIQYYTGMNAGLQIQSGASFVNGVNMLSTNINVQSGGAANNGVSGIVIGGNIDSGASVTGGISGLNMNFNVNDGITGNGLNGINIGNSISTGANYVNALFDNTNLNSGGVLVNGYTSLGSNFTFHSGSGANYITAVQAGGQLQSGSTVDIYTGVNISPLVDTTLTNSLTLLQASPNGTGGAPNVTGLSVNLSDMDSTGRKVGLNINDGIINAGANITTASSLGVDSINTITPMLTIQNGSPITGTTVFGHNLANLLFANDDFAAGALPGISLGAVAYVGQIAVASGKTVDGVSMAVSGGQFSGDGTTSNLVLYNALGGIPGTGTPVVTNLYGFKDGGLLSLLATNSWGIHISDATASNYLKRLAVNTASEKNTATKDFDVLGDSKLDGALQVTDLTAGVVLSDASGNLSSSSVLSEANGGTNQSTYTTGDTLYASASNTLSKLPIGSSGDVLTVVAGVPAWAPNSGSGPADSTIALDTGIGHGSSGTAIRTFGAVTTATGTDLTYTPDAVNGDYITVNTTGRYSMMWFDRNSGGAAEMGFSVNQSNLTQNPSALPSGELIFFSVTPSVGGSVTASYYLTAGDVVRFNDGGSCNNTTSSARQAIMTRIG